MTNPLIEPAELAAALTEADMAARPVVIDVRWQLGRGVTGNLAEYLAGHVPEAAFIDLETGLAGQPHSDGVGGRHPMPTLTAAADAFRAAGVMADRPVVVYDGANSLAAARAWWLLAYFGRSDVRVLNGGYAAWSANGLPTTTGPVSPARGDVDLMPGQAPLLDGAEVADVAGRGDHHIIDARAAERYRGEVEPMDPVAGHIPGALNLPTLDTLASDGRFLPTAQIAEMIADRQITSQGHTVLYCGSGVQAAHLALAMQVSDPHTPMPGLYVGSWSDWVSDPHRRVATGSG